MIHRLIDLAKLVGQTQMEVSRSECWLEETEALIECYQKQMVAVRKRLASDRKTLELIQKFMEEEEVLDKELAEEEPSE